MVRLVAAVVCSLAMAAETPSFRVYRGDGTPASLDDIAE